MSQVQNPERSPWKHRFFKRWTEGPGEQQAAEEVAEATKLGGSRVDCLPGRCRATVCGTLRTVTLRPRAGVPALEAELFDGTGTIAVVWLGRRRIAGIEPGRRMRIEGFITHDDGGRVVYNPRYELVPGSEA